MLFSSLNILYGQAQIDTIVSKECNRYMLNKGTIGLSVGVIFNDKNFTFNYGLAKISGADAPTANSIYSIGSVSKTFIAMLLAKTVLEKQVNLQDDIRKYLPDSIMFDQLQFNQNPVRLINLANHTSRIPSQLAKLPQDWNKFSAYQKYDFKKAYTEDKFLQDLKDINLDTVPGYKYEYSNAGFKVLSIILENIYKMPFDQIINKYVCRDLKMNDTKVFLQKSEWQERFAGGSQDINILMSTKDIDDYTSGPGLYSTVNDMLRYLSYNISEENEAIKLTHKKTYTNDEKVEIGLAWRVDYTSDGETYFYHSGSGSGCTSICLFSPKKKIGIIVLANETSDQKKIIDLGISIFTEIASKKK